MLYKEQEIKSSNWDKIESEGLVKGYVSVFGNKDSDGDVITNGAYKKTLDENSDRIAFLWQHRMDKPIGKNLHLEEDELGLYAEAKIADTQFGRDVRTMIIEGIIKEFSVGFIPIKEESINDVNFIREIKLFEYSLVTLAANSQARITEYKSATVDSILDSFDHLVDVTKKLKDPRSIEFEVLKMKDKLNYFLTKESQNAPEERESAEAKKILQALNSYFD